MGGHDAVETALSAQTFEKLVPNNAQTLLDIAFGLRFRAKNRNRNGPAFAEFPDRCLVPIRVTATELIIHMCDQEGKFVFISEPDEERQKRNAVGATRDSNDDL